MIRPNGVAFSTFAAKYIRNELYSELRYERIHCYDLHDDVKLVFLDAPINEEENKKTFLDELSDDFDMDEHILDIEEIEILHKVINMLKTREQLILRMYYFLGMKQDDIADHFNMTRANVSRILKNIEEKIRKKLAWEYRR